MFNKIGGPVVNPLKLFSSSLMDVPNKLECLSHQVFSYFQISVSKARSQHSSLLRTFIIYRRKKLYNIDTRFVFVASTRGAVTIHPKVHLHARLRSAFCT